MSHSNEPKRDELADRLLDQALGEVLGGERPPDLSDKILAAVEERGFVSSQQKENVMDKSRRGYRVWVLCAAAACLVVGVGISLMLSSGPQPRQTALEIAESEGELARDRSRLMTRLGPSVGYEAARLEDGAVSVRTAPAGVPAGTSTDSKERYENLTAANVDGEDEEDDGGASLLLHERAPKVVEVTEPVERRLQARWSYSPAPAPGSRVPRDGTPSRGSVSAGKPANMLGRAWWRADEAAATTDGRERILGDPADGRGPGVGGDQYDQVVENPFRAVMDHPLSTFSIDVDTASYANVRRFLLADGQLPPPGAVRIEELLNYFDYDYAGPEDDVPFASHIEVAGCPWTPGHRLVRVGLKGKELRSEERPPSNLVFLLDVSGSMNSADKLPLLKKGMKLLAKQLRDEDRVAIVVYASAEGLVLPSTPGAKRAKILAALDRLEAGGSTNGGAGIELAYQIAQQNFIPDGVNRVLLCTDGDFNVGTTSTAALVRRVEEKARSGVFLSVLGFGRGNLNDAMMETISNKGNGNYAYIDGITEARKVLVRQMGGTLVTIAKDVKIQIEFNPQQVAAYRLIGYENRILAAEDFNDDKKDAGEIGAGHTVTALYEVVPSGAEVDTPAVDPLKYQAPRQPGDDRPSSEELLTLKLRYKDPEATTSKLLEFALVDSGARFGEASYDLQFTAAVASFGMLLRNSEHKGGATYDAVLEIAAAAKGPDVHGYRAELLEMVRRAKALAGG